MTPREQTAFSDRDGLAHRLRVHAESQHRSKLTVSIFLGEPHLAPFPEAGFWPAGSRQVGQHVIKPFPGSHQLALPRTVPTFSKRCRRDAAGVTNHQSWGGAGLTKDLDDLVG